MRVCVCVERQVTEGQIKVEDAAGLARVEFTPTVQVSDRIQNTPCHIPLTPFRDTGSGTRPEDCQGRIHAAEKCILRGVE